MQRRTLYVAKCYWPDVSQTSATRATRRAVIACHTSGAPRTKCLGAILFPLDDLVLCLFEAASAGDVRDASEMAGMPCERVMPAAWLSGQDELEVTSTQITTTGTAERPLTAESEPQQGAGERRRPVKRTALGGPTRVAGTPAPPTTIQ